MTAAAPEVRYARGRDHWVPELSLVMPCYNEEACLGETAPALIQAFADEHIDLELVLVDNGSRDRTGAIIDGFMAAGLPVTKVHIPVNQGYGHGIVRGLEACRAPVIGYLCADGQVAPEDVVRTYRLTTNRAERVLTKVRRRFRQDSLKRKIVSIIYNGLMLGLFGWLGAIDVNGSPKIFSRRAFRAMRLRSDDWFLDPELILKANRLGLRVIEIDVEGYARHAGVSHVKRQTILEFLRNIWYYRTSGYLRQWLADSADFRAERDRDLIPERPAPANGNSLVRPLIERIVVLDQSRHEDHRGFVQKVLTATQAGGHPPAGEVYVTSALPGESKGHHYHRRMGEWFSVVQGRGLLLVADPSTGDRREIEIGADRPRSVYVPAGLAHAVANTGDEVLICVAWAEREHDPADVFPLRLEVPARTAS
ncbi:MAG TPA: glycosyltransferase [Gemmatimonadales bacterium]|nr:glycosyltransferase [Gemmatimonadales bacterium]